MVSHHYGSGYLDRPRSKLGVNHENWHSLA